MRLSSGLYVHTYIHVLAHTCAHVHTCTDTEKHRSQNGTDGADTGQSGRNSASLYSVEQGTDFLDNFIASEASFPPLLASARLLWSLLSTER